MRSLPAQPVGAARIAVDLLGGAEAPAGVVDGALLAGSADPAPSLAFGPCDAAGEAVGASDAFADTGTLAAPQGVYR